MPYKIKSSLQIFFISPIQFIPPLIPPLNNGDKVNNKIRSKRYLLYFFLISFLISFNSCINLEQTTKINEDRSGTIKLHYWTKSANLSMGDEIGGFSFTQDKAIKNYTSSNSEVTNIAIDNLEYDSSTHVQIDISFKDLNKLSNAAGFSMIKASWVKGDEKIDFKYVILKDTSVSNSPAADKYNLEYKFYFPDEVISSDGTVKENSVTWNKSLADLKENIEMNASIKTKSKICGIFGMELPVILILGFAFMYLKITKRGSKNIGTELHSPH